MPYFFLNSQWQSREREDTIEWCMFISDGKENPYLYKCATKYIHRRCALMVSISTCIRIVSIMV